MRLNTKYILSLLILFIGCKAQKTITEEDYVNPLLDNCEILDRLTLHQDYIASTVGSSTLKYRLLAYLDRTTQELPEEFYAFQWVAYEDYYEEQLSEYIHLSKDQKICEKKVLHVDTLTQFRIGNRAYIEKLKKENSGYGFMIRDWSANNNKFTFFLTNTTLSYDGKYAMQSFKEDRGDLYMYIYEKANNKWVFLSRTNMSQWIQF